jgi:hypothetical protein
LDEAIRALENLLTRYGAYCENPQSSLHWRHCELAHRRILGALDQQVAKQLDALIDEQQEEGNGTTVEALEILRKAKPHQIAQEQALACSVGFKKGEVRKFERAAQKELGRSRANSEPPASTAEVRQCLKTIHYQVREAYEDSTGQSKSVKNAHRLDAKEYLRIRLYMVASLLLNVQRQDLFHIAHATTVGMARVRPKERKHLRIATCNRPALPIDGPEGTAEAA